MRSSLQETDIITVKLHSKREKEIVGKIFTSLLVSSRQRTFFSQDVEVELTSLYVLEMYTEAWQNKEQTSQSV